MSWLFGNHVTVNPLTDCFERFMITQFYQLVGSAGFIVQGTFPMRLVYIMPS
jgi:hypothetical protein